MNQAQAPHFDWSDCSVADRGNRAFLNGERPFISEQKDRGFNAIFLPTFWTSILCLALAQITSLWLCFPISFLVWLFLFSLHRQGVRKLKHLAPGAILALRK